MAFPPLHSDQGYPSKAFKKTAGSFDDTRRSDRLSGGASRAPCPMSSDEHRDLTANANRYILRRKCPLMLPHRNG
jgi:hypothetical protein